MSNVIQLPLMVTSDPDEIFQGRMRALALYSAARSDKERRRALFFVNYWRALDAAVKAQGSDFAA